MAELYASRSDAYYNPPEPRPDYERMDALRDCRVDDHDWQTGAHGWKECRWCPAYKCADTKCNKASVADDCCAKHQGE